VDDRLYTINLLGDERILVRDNVLGFAFNGEVLIGFSRWFYDSRRSYEIFIYDVEKSEMIYFPVPEMYRSSGIYEIALVENYILIYTSLGRLHLIDMINHNEAIYFTQIDNHHFAVIGDHIIYRPAWRRRNDGSLYRDSNLRIRDLNGNARLITFRWE